MTYKEQKNYDDMSSALREAGVSFEDTTYGNDLTASISVLLPHVGEFLDGGQHNLDEEFQIYIPNSDTFDPENEEFNTFSVTMLEQGRTVDFRRTEEVIDYLQSFTN
tara:strand:- start:692 stop:1012 length:321 start_codon:yes stop_codon:yes gene_type:complete